MEIDLTLLVGLWSLGKNNVYVDILVFGAKVCIVKTYFLVVIIHTLYKFSSDK